MSTTVSYNGSTIATVENQTKTLLTADHWLLDNITITDAGGTWSFLPASAELVASADQTINLSTDTTFDSWTPSTSSTTILAAGTTRDACSYTIPTTDLDDTALIGAAIVRVPYVYKSGTTVAKGYGDNSMVTCIGLYSPVSIRSFTSSHYGLLQYAAATRLIYYNTDTGTTVGTTTSYGIGATGITWSPTAVSGTSVRTVGFTRPAIIARCSTTYFTTEAAGNIDSANTNIYCHYKIWKVPKEDHIYGALFDYPDGLFIDQQIIFKI